MGSANSNIVQVVIPPVIALSVASGGMILIPDAVYDGATDNSVAIESLLAYAAGVNVTVCIPGPMAVLTPLAIPASVHLVFTGNGQITDAGTAGVVLTLNGAYMAPPWQVWNFTGAGSCLAGKFTHTLGRLLTEHWGAFGNNGLNDDWPGFTACAIAAHQAGDLPIQLLAKAYSLSKTVLANGTAGKSFTAPSWYGLGRLATTINYAAIAAGAPAFKFRGGSGRNPGSVVEGVGFQGNANSIGIQYSGTNSMAARNCLFGTNLYGLEFFNEDPGSFTESCVGDNSQFNCTTPVHYRVGAGNSSFHGSGLTNSCLISLSSSSAVLIDAGAQPYQAPFDALIFPAGASTLFNNARTAPPRTLDFFGSIRVELAGGSLVLGAGGGIDFLGPIMGVGVQNPSGAGITAGTLRQVTKHQTAADSSVASQGYEGPQTLAMTTGANTLASKVGGAHRLTYVRFFASNYDCRYLIGAVGDGFGAAAERAVIATYKTFDQAGYGVPIFSGDTNGNIVATGAAWPASGMTCFMYELQIAGESAGADQMLF